MIHVLHSMNSLAQWIKMSIIGNVADLKMHFLENIILYITILYVNALLFAHFHSGLFFSHHFWCPFILLEWLRQLLSALQNETETCFLFDVTWLMYFDNALADIWKNSWLFWVLQKVFFFFLINPNVHHPLNVSLFFFSIGQEKCCAKVLRHLWFLCFASNELNSFLLTFLSALEQ